MFHFLEKLQSSDESTKRRWMFGSAVVIMIVVVYVWFAYFNTLVAGFSAPAPAATEGGFSFFGSMENGLAIISGAFMEKIHAFGRILAAPREYIVNPPK